VHSASIDELRGVARGGNKAARRGGACCSPAGTWALGVVELVLVVAIGTAITYVTPVDAIAIWLDRRPSTSPGIAASL
jgi:hypothetical protein